MRSTLTPVLLLTLLTACGEHAPEPTGDDAPEVATETAPDWVDGPAGRLRVAVEGTGEPAIVFVHGNGSDRRAWRRQVAHFSPRNRVITFDLRGMGESDPAPDGDYSVGAMTDDLAAVVDALGLERFVLVGHSYGGAVVATYAGRHPERLLGVVYADVGGTWRPTPEEREQLTAGLAPERYERFTSSWFEGLLENARKPTRQQVMATLRATPREVFVGAVEGLWSYEVEAAQAPYHGPKMAIAAEPLDRDTSLHRRLDGIAVRIVPGVSHWLMLDDPETFDRHLGEFVAAL